MSKCSCNDCDKCILHCEKNDWFEIDDNGNKNWDNKKINFFWNQIQKDLNEKYEESFYETEVINEIYIYDNVIFPKFQKDIPYNKYEDNQVELGTNFYSYFCFTDDEGVYREELNTIISKLNVSFKNCKFLDNVELSRYNFKKDLDFKKCEFFGNFNLNNTNVKGRITFSKSFFYKKLNISLSRFSNFSINHSFIYEIKTTNAIFEELSVFSNNIFYLDVYFEMNTFEKIAYFRNSIFLRKLNLRDTIFKEDKNFLGISFKLDDDKLNQMDLSEKNKKYVKSLEIEKEYSLGDRETARIIKDSFEQQNNIIEANKFYALEMKEREKELEEDIKKGKNIFEWLVFKVHGLSSNHSQDWLLPIFWILNISILIPFFELICFETLKIEMTIFITTYFYLLIYLVTYSDKYRAITIIISAILIYMVFYKLSPSINLNSMSSNLNPFSIMIESNGAEKKDLDFINLIFKSTIAYLIYQLIVSIRQNTRRK